MKAYKFIFIVGFLNLFIPFLSIPFVYKNYVLIFVSIITLAYALILRAVEKEIENNLLQKKQKSIYHNDEINNHVQNKTIEQVVDMIEENKPFIVSDVVVKTPGRKSKITSQSKIYE